MLAPFAEDLYVAEGPVVPFAGFPYPTRMVVVRLSTGEVWVWSPVALSEQLAAAVDSIGPVRYIVSPNKLHHLFLAEWSARWPEARLYAPPGLARRKRQFHFEAELGDQNDTPWIADIDQVVFRGSLAIDEVAFFHRASRTAIFGDLIQRFPTATMKGWKRLLLQVGGVLGPHGSTPRDWRLTFVARARTRAARRTVLEWKPQRLVIAHGECATSGATEIIAAALRWM
jgi:hypothetical protein